MELNKALSEEKKTQTANKPSFKVFNIISYKGTYTEIPSHPSQNDCHQKYTGKDTRKGKHFPPDGRNAK